MKATEAPTDSDTVLTDGMSVDHLFELLKEKLKEDSPSVKYVAERAQRRGVVVRKWTRLESTCYHHRGGYQYRGVGWRK